MTGTTVQPSHEPPHERKGTGTLHTEKHQWRKNQQSLGGGGGREKMADRTQHEGKLNAQMNHLVDVANYWACACQRQLTSGA